jgi:putative acetyltransferase
MLIRAFRNQDAEALAELFHSSVRKAGLRDYNLDQVEAWSPARPDPCRYIERGLEDRTFLVAVDDRDEPVAYGDLKADGHIDHLYCRPDVIGTGVASALYDKLEAAARQRGLSRITVNASEAARRLFLKKGFWIVRRNDLVRKGVPIHNFAMEKPLEP